MHSPFQILKNICFTILFLTLCFACTVQSFQSKQFNAETEAGDLFIKILGIAQDAGYPQANCQKECCQRHWNGEEAEKYVVSLGIVDVQSGQKFMMEATPDFKHQLQMLEMYPSEHGILDGIFLTHAHIGHYTGLMDLGKEVMNTSKVKTYAMPRMEDFLQNNGPWSQLVSNQNIDLMPLQAQSPVHLTKALTITPIIVPHRDEFSETVGYIIAGSTKKVLFIPDIDKWDKWELDIREEIKKVDIALLDGTFYQNGEIWGRDMSQIPHPFIEESMKLFATLEPSEKQKVHFIHFNHTNPVLRAGKARNEVLQKGFNIAEIGQIIDL